MIGLFLVTHGTLGEALIQCVCHVLDKRPPLLGQLGLSAGEDPADALPLARRMIATVDDGEGVLLLPDLYGATPCNVATRLIEPGRIELVAGVSLPMLLRVYWPPEEFDQLQNNIDQALAGQAPAAGFEMRIMRKNGERFDVRLYFSPLIDAGGRQIGWIASMNDITEPRRVRVELELAHERFVTVIDGLDTAVHVADAGSGEILFANRAFQNIFGFDTAGRDSALVTAACRPPPEALDRDPAHLEPADLPCEIFDGEIRHAVSGRWYHLHERAIRWVDGRTVRVQIAADITDRRHVDEVNLCTPAPS